MHFATGVLWNVSVVCMYCMCHKKDSPLKFIHQCNTNATQANKHHWLVINEATIQCDGVHTRKDVPMSYRSGVIQLSQQGGHSGCLVLPMHLLCSNM